MSKQPKLTEWFPSSQKPTLVGVYQCRGGMPGNTETYQHWNGEKWGMWAKDVKGAASDSRTTSIRQNPEWRGLASDPKGA